ncbi:unnamed protein product [Pleuronectes platessa]|uniref:Retinitis pigmentosa 1-like 1 protein n=1 Tax=Pleuronectes platessa TaxID=8262 RepID=A0A9N7V339_PLEPL|nr:unnamed protein product [Pleuronectes platessa]
MSSSSAKVRNKSPASANVAKTPVGDSSSNDTGNISEVKGQEDVAASVHSKSPFCLRPESAASAQSGSKTKVRSIKGRESRSKAGSNSGDVETLVKSSDPCPLHDSRPSSKVESETTLSHSLSAADLLKETMAACPDRPESKASKTSDRTGGEKSPKSQRKRNQKEKKPDLTPACLPNASPNEVVNNWLRSIPANSGMLALGDELEEGEQEAEEKPGEEEVAQVEESPEDDKVEEEEKAEVEEGAEKEGEAKCDTAEEEQNSDPAPGDEKVASCPTGLESADSLPRNLHPSVAVMKVLLSSSLGRCRSLPEVSPVYGRRLSTSARGFLDCLAQLQLIEPALRPGCDLQKNPNHQYDEIMTILQSLWLTGPSDTEFKKGKDIGKEQVTPPRSSSGVGMSSGSGGSGKENGNKDGHETPPKEIESLPEVQVPSEDQSTLPQSLDSPKATENPSSSDKSSANDSSKSPTDNEQEPLDDTSSGTPSTVLRAPLSQKLSQDPDPVWVLHLLKKVEKQFINHYINAMAEFKVRWDLDDSLILDTMMSELKEEVSRRIQSSIEREIRKIKGRAGRGGRSPRPPLGAHLSRESTMTEKRRRILKVMKNQSVKTTDSVSDEEMEGDFSDQRSDDEYCPCDACVRKKMDARPLMVNPLAANAPVKMEFDLLKILQLKKSPEPAPVAVHQSAELEGEEGRNLEVVQEEEEEEEEEETKEDIKAEFVLEDMIPEEDEEEGEGQTEEDEKVEREEQSEDGKEQEEGEKEGEVAGEEAAQENGEEEEGEGQTEEEEKVEKEENSEEGKEQEEGEKEGEETGEEGAQGNDDEEEEGEAECQCQCARNEEESDKAEEEEETEETGDNTGEDEVEDDEDETGTGEEESDLETVKEAPPEEEETTEKESGEEEAEDEDDGENGGGEEESHEEGEGGESEEQEGPPPQNQGATEGEEADAEDSDTDKKSPSDTSADEVVAGTTGEEEEKEAGGGDAVEEFKPEEEEEEEEEVKGSRKEAGALLHQFTRTSVESQPGSLEDIHTDSAPVSTIEVPKMGSTGGGASPKRSRSPGRVKCRKPKDRDMDQDDY